MIEWHFFVKERLANLKEKILAAKAASIMKKYFGMVIGHGDAHAEIIKQKNGGNENE